MENNNLLLDVRNLIVEYKTYDGSVKAVNNISFSLNEGETLGLVGETGAGKTTTVKSIMKILPTPPAKVNSGEIFFENQDVLKKSNKEMRAIRGNKISMIFQDPMTSLNPVIPVVDQILESIKLHNKELSKKEQKAKAESMLELVGISKSRGGEYPHQFSGGMKQRVVIAMALACNPKLLIADEPTTALDVTIQAQVLKLVKDLKEKYKTSMILITHDLGIVAETCDMVAIMYAGEIVEYGNKKHIFKEATHPYTQGLFACIPSLFEDVEILPIQGLTPDPINLPEGCKFHPRCPKVMDICRIENPQTCDLGDGHLVKCHLINEGGNKNV